MYIYVYLGECCVLCISNLHVQYMYAHTCTCTCTRRLYMYMYVYIYISNSVAVWLRSAQLTQEGVYRYRYFKNAFPKAMLGLW